MPRHRVLARICSFLGLLAASLAWWGFSLGRTVLDPSASATLAQDILESQAVQEFMVGRIGDELGQALPPGHQRAIGRAAERAVADPEFRLAFTDAFTQLHRQLLSDDGTQVRIDTRRVTTAARRSLTIVAPRLAAQLQDGNPVVIRLGSEKLPSLGVVDRAASNLVTGLAVAAVLLLALGVLLHPDPRAWTSRTGRRVAALGLPVLVFCIVGTVVVERVGGDWGSAVLPFIQFSRARLLLPATVVFAAGLAVWGSHRFIRRAETEPAAPAGDGPPAPRVAAAPMPNLAEPAAGGFPTRTDVRA